MQIGLVSFTVDKTGNPADLRDQSFLLIWSAAVELSLLIDSASVRDSLPRHDNEYSQHSRVFQHIAKFY